MSGILIYSKEEAQRNAFSVERFKKYLGVKLVLENEIDFSLPADFVINRTNNAGIAQNFEDCGIRVFNPAALTRLANDKQKCYEFMRENGIEIMPINQIEPPLVEKPANGKGGRDVRLIKSGKVAFKKGFVYQKPASDLGKDLRVWLIGGKIICAVLRKSETDFRSNYCLGGSAEIYRLSKSERALVYKIASRIKYDYIGIDFVFDGGKAVFNEIEDAVGARMVYDKTDIDILRLYCEYIKKELK